MMTFMQYIEKARKNKNISSKNQIAKILDISSAAISRFEQGQSYPSEATMARLAMLANVSEKQAIIDLNLWKTKNNPYTYKIWKELSVKKQTEEYNHLSFAQYVKKAKENSNIDSNNKVADRLGITSASVAIFCNERGYPSQETVLKLANLAGVKPEQALIDFNLWKTKDKPNAHKVWKELSEKLKFLSCVWVVAVSLSTNCFSKETTSLIQSADNTPHIYYATKMLGDVASSL